MDRMASPPTENPRECRASDSRLPLCERRDRIHTPRHSYRGERVPGTAPRFYTDGPSAHTGHSASSPEWSPSAACLSIGYRIGTRRLAPTPYCLCVPSVTLSKRSCTCNENRSWIGPHRFEKNQGSAVRPPSVVTSAKQNASHRSACPSPPSTIIFPNRNHQLHADGQQLKALMAGFTVFQGFQHRIRIRTLLVAHDPQKVTLLRSSGNVIPTDKNVSGISAGNIREIMQRNPCAGHSRF